jgi:hypothetical protein
MQNGTRVMSCVCVSKFQDATYGAGRRLHNAMKADGKFRCTVCEREKDTGERKPVKQEGDKK